MIVKSFGTGCTNSCASCYMGAGIDMNAQLIYNNVSPS